MQRNGTDDHVTNVFNMQALLSEAHNAHTPVLNTFFYNGIPAYYNSYQRQKFNGYISMLTLKTYLKALMRR